MRCTFKTVFYVNRSKERNGIVPIMGRVTINGTIAQFSCKQSVTKAIWDAKGNRAIGKSKEAKEPYGVSPKNGIFAIERNKRRRALKRRCQINRYIHGTILFA